MVGDAFALLRTGDNDRYLALQFAPASLRNDLAGLFALDIELARVEALVTEPLMGELRLTWWREALAGADESTGNPIADGVARAMAGHDLAQHTIETMIEARRQDLYDQPVADLAELAEYFADTAGSVLVLACRMLGQRQPDSELCARAALVLGLTRMAGHLAGGRVHQVSRLVPAEILAGLPGGEAVLRKDLSPGAQAGLLTELLKYTNDAWRAAHDRFGQVPVSLLPVFLPLALVNGDLKRFSRSQPGAGAFISPMPHYRRVIKLLIDGRRARVV